MRINKLLKGSVLGTLGLVMGGILVTAQEPLPPAATDGPKNVTVRKGVAKRFFFAGGMEFNDKLVVGAPFSAEATTVTDQTLADGTHIHRQNGAILYRDGQGRTRRETALGGFGPWSASEGESKQVVMINDPVAGVHYLLHPDERLATQMPLPSVAMAKGMSAVKVSASKVESGKATAQVEDRVFDLPVPPPVASTGDVFWVEREEENGQTESLGTQVMEGVKVQGTRTTSTIAAGSIGNDQPIQIVTERWYSAELQMVVMSKKSDPRVGETTYRLTNINRAEPAATLFQVPSDYTVEKGPEAPKLYEFRHSVTESKP